MGIEMKEFGEMGVVFKVKIWVILGMMMMILWGCC